MEINQKKEIKDQGEDTPDRNQDKNQNEVNPNQNQQNENQNLIADKKPSQIQEENLDQIRDKNQNQIHDDNQDEIKEENIIDFNELKNEKSDLPISNFNYINNLDFLNIGISEINKENNELDDLLLYYEEELNTLFNLNNVQKLTSIPKYNSKILKETLLKFIDFKNYIVYFKINKKDKKEENKKNAQGKNTKEKEKEFPSESSIKTLSFSEKSFTKRNEMNFLKKRLFPRINIENIMLKNKGKEYEKRVINDFNIFLKYLFNKDIKISSNPSTSIKFLYSQYENLIKKENYLKNLNIYYKSENDPVAEFDILIKDIKKNDLSQMVENFKPNIISYNLQNLEDDKNYEAIGEVAQDILNQAIDKKTQISKYIDIILIDSILREKLGKNHEFFKNYEKLNLSMNDKLIIIFTNGSYIKLLKSFKEIKNVKNINVDNYHNERDIKNIRNLKVIIDLIEKSGISYIIFYLENFDKDNVENYLINYIKYKKSPLLIQKLENQEKIFIKNESESYFIKSKIKKLEDNKEMFYEEILNSFVIRDEIINKLNDFFSDTITLKHEESIKITVLFIKNEKPKKYNYYQQLINKFFNKSIYKIFYKSIDINELENYNTSKINYEKEYFIAFYESQNNMLDTEQKLQSIFKGIKCIEFKFFQLKTLDEIEINIKNKYKNLVKRKIKKYLDINYINYKENEYLKFNNLKQKIIYDLKKINYVFICKDNGKIYFDIDLDKSINYELSFVANFFETKIFSSDDLKILNFNPQKLIVDEVQYKTLIEHLCSWILYFYFFDKTLFSDNNFKI